MQVDQVANKLTQWIEHLRSTTDFVVPEEVSRILDLVPRLRIIVKNLNNPDIVKRIISGPEPSAQVAAEDDAVLLIHHDPFSRYKSIRQVSLGPEDFPSDDDLPALQGEPVQQDVTMADVPSVSNPSIRRTSYSSLSSGQEEGRRNHGGRTRR